MESNMAMHDHASVRKNGFEGFQRKHRYGVWSLVGLWVLRKI